MAPTRITIGQTGDFLTVADAKDAAGQQAWERARDVAIQFAQKPGTAVGARLLAFIGQRSNIGDPRQPDWLENLPPGHQITVLQELQQLVTSWHLQDGRNVDGSRNPTVPGVTTVIAQAGTIVSMPTAGKAATAAALRLAADQAGPARAELLVKAAIAEREAAEAAKAAAVATSRSEAAWLARAQRRIDAGRARALARARAEARSKAAAATTRTAAPDDMLFKRAGGAG